MHSLTVPSNLNPGPKVAFGVSSRRACLIGLPSGCADVAAILGPAPPTQALLDLQSLALGGDQTALIAALADDRSRVAELPDRLRKFYLALCQAGPTHAGDEWLLEAVGVTRPRVVHWLKELEAARTRRG